MNKKIILGLGLCLLLTVINLHRAMDNYGITDAKFKVGVLADESSSSGGGGYIYKNEICDCMYGGNNCTPGRIIILFETFEAEVDSDGDWFYIIPEAAIACYPGGPSPCLNIDCRKAEATDVRYK